MAQHYRVSIMLVHDRKYRTDRTEQTN